MSAATLAFEEKAPCIVIPVDFVTTLGATPAIVLAFFWNWHKTMSKNPKYAGEIYKTLQKVADETGLSPFQVRKAKKQLESSGLIETRVDKKEKNATFWKPILEKITALIGEHKSIKEVKKPHVEQIEEKTVEKPVKSCQNNNVELPKTIAPIADAQVIDKFRELQPKEAIEVKSEYNNATGIKNPLAFLKSLMAKKVDSRTIEGKTIETAATPSPPALVKINKPDLTQFDETTYKVLNTGNPYLKPDGTVVLKVPNNYFMPVFIQHLGKLEELLNNKIELRIGT